MAPAVTPLSVSSSFSPIGISGLSVAISRCDFSQSAGRSDGTGGRLICASVDRSVVSPNSWSLHRSMADSSTHRQDADVIASSIVLAPAQPTLDPSETPAVRLCQSLLPSLVDHSVPPRGATFSDCHEWGREGRSATIAIAVTIARTRQQQRPASTGHIAIDVSRATAAAQSEQKSQPRSRPSAARPQAQPQSQPESQSQSQRLPRSSSSSQAQQEEAQ